MYIYRIVLVSKQQTIQLTAKKRKKQNQNDRKLKFWCYLLHRQLALYCANLVLTMKQTDARTRREWENGLPKIK